MKTFNASKTRKVAQMIRRLIGDLRKKTGIAKKPFDMIDELAKELLIMPLRNCDVGTVEYQEKRFDAYCTSKGMCKRCRDCASTKCLYTKDPWRCILEWEQMPYKDKKVETK